MSIQNVFSWRSVVKQGGEFPVGPRAIADYKKGLKDIDIEHDDVDGKLQVTFEAKPGYGVSSTVTIIPNEKRIEISVQVHEAQKDVDARSVTKTVDGYAGGTGEWNVSIIPIANDAQGKEVRLPAIDTHSYFLKAPA